MAQPAVYVAKDHESISMGAYPTLKEAYEAAKPNSRIKLAPDVYSESIVIQKPGLVIEPIEKTLDVTIR
jgi:F-box protein 11